MLQRVARLGAIFFSWQKLKNSSGLMKTGIMLTPSRFVAVRSLSAFFSHSSKASGSVSPLSLERNNNARAPLCGGEE
jgi:hypothetical protein